MERAISGSGYIMEALCICRLEELMDVHTSAQASPRLATAQVAALVPLALSLCPKVVRLRNTKSNDGATSL